MAKLTIKNNSVQEANEPVSFGKAYQDFVNRCWTDHKPNYSVNAINFLLDCAHIANGTSVKGLPQQGFKLTKAGNVDIVGDCLHLCYTEVNGKKAVDIWLNPHTQKALVDLYGFNPEDPYSSTHKEFSARDYTSNDFYEFIKNLPNYKGESKTGESKMKKCSMTKKIESLRKKDEKDDYPDDYYTWADEKVDEEYADESGIFFEIVDDMMRLAESMAEDIISEQGLEDTEKTKEDLKDVIYDRMCDTMVNMFGGVSRNNF